MANIHCAASLTLVDARGRGYDVEGAGASPAAAAMTEWVKANASKRDAARLACTPGMRRFLAKGIAEGHGASLTGPNGAAAVGMPRADYRG